MTWFVVVLVAFLVTYNNLTTLRSLPGWTYVPLNLSVAAVLVIAARAAGLGWTDLGLGREGVVPGSRWGGAIALVVAAGLALAFIVPGAERFLMDRRVAGMTGGALVYTALIRVPVGTALLEEVAFRGVLFGAWERVATPLAAAVGSSIVFGLWHIGPTLELLRANELGGNSFARVGFVVVGVIATAIAGLLFVWLRLRTNGIVAPFVAHASTNSLAYVAAYIWQRG